MRYAEPTIGGDTYDVEYSAEFHSAEEYFTASGWNIELKSVKIGEWGLEVLPLLTEDQIQQIIEKIDQDEISNY